MRKVKLSLSYCGAEALCFMLCQYCKFRKNNCRHDLERLLIATGWIVAQKTQRRIELRFNKQKTFNYTIAEGYALKQIMLDLVMKDDLQESIRIYVLMHIDKQLPR